MLDFVSGMATMGFVAAGLFFFRFWSRTRDAIFVYFSVAFSLLAIGQALGTLTELAGDDRAWIYLLRLAAFALLIVGIVAKNFGPSTGKAGGD
jgi:hypothetical protein